MLNVFLCVVWLNAGVSDQLTPSDLLDRYRAYQANLTVYAATCEQVAEIDDSETGHSVLRAVYQFRTDGQRLDCDMKESFELSPLAAATNAISPPIQASNERVIWDGRETVSYSLADPNRPSPWPAAVRISDRDSFPSSFMAVAYGGAPLDGFFFADRLSVDAILAQASSMAARPEREDVGGAACYVLDATTPHGKYSLWIDPDHGFGLARAEVHRTGDDIHNGKPLSASGIGPNVPPEIAARLPGRIREFEFRLDRIHFRRIDDVWVPVEADYQYTKNYANGRTMTERRHHRRTQVDLNPDFAALGAFVPDIPDGARVWIRGAEGIDYKWIEGRPLVDIDDDVYEQLEAVTKRLTDPPDAAADRQPSAVAPPSDRRPESGYAPSNDSAGPRTGRLAQSEVIPLRALTALFLGLSALAVTGTIVLYRLTSKEH